MANLVLLGEVAQVELTRDDEDGQVIATCYLHRPESGRPPVIRCDWTERYDTLDDASEYASDHADRG